MIGQDKLVAKLKSYSIATLPHSILFVGDKGCGKHTLIKELEKHFKIESRDISDSLELETLQEISLCPISYFYIVDMNRVNEKQQNVILKFLEEPTTNTYIILLATSKSILLDTIINRCVSFEFEPYSTNQLLQFLPFEQDIEMLVEYCHTPGQVLSMNVDKVKDLIELCNNIINNVGKARFPNIFKITSRVLEDKDNEYRLDVFYNVLLKRLQDYFEEIGNVVYKEMYNITSDALKKHLDTRLNQELLIDSLVIDLHEVSRGRV